ncbi:translation initiation factor IF-3 [Ornithobacterium rhinotracheale]
MAKKRFGGFRPSNRNEDQHKINENIHVPEVRVVGDVEEIEQGVYKTSQALEWAQERGLDLVLITENAKPPVAKILDYKKFLHDEKKRKKEMKAKQSKVVIKEIRFGPNTDEHDYEFKKRHAESFLKDGAKLKAYVFFKGRSIVFKDQGEILLLKLAQDLEEFGKVEQMPKLEGKRMIMMMAPTKTK